jgi:hypothetical protein
MVPMGLFEWLCGLHLNLRLCLGYVSMHVLDGPSAYPFHVASCPLVGSGL